MLRSAPDPMAVAAIAALEPLPTPLPAVAREAVIPGGFQAAGGIAGIKASGRPDLAIVATGRLSSTPPSTSSRPSGVETGGNTPGIAMLGYTASTIRPVR